MPYSLYQPPVSYPLQPQAGPSTSHYYPTDSTSTSTASTPAPPPALITGPVTVGIEVGVGPTQPSWTNYGSSTGQWGLWSSPDVPRPPLPVTYTDAERVPLGSGDNIMMPTQESVAVIQNGMASNRMLSYGLMAGAGQGAGCEKQEIFDTYEAPAIHLETGDRFSQLLEAKLNLMNQAQAQSHAEIPQQIFSAPYRNAPYGAFPVPTQDENAIPPLPMQMQSLPPASQNNFPPLQPQKSASYSPTTQSQQISQNVSVIPGLQPSPWNWQSIVTNEQYGEPKGEDIVPCQALQRSPPRPQYDYQHQQEQSSSIDPSTVDALLRDWSQTQIQPDLVAPLPLEVASRPSSSGLSSGNRNGSYQADMPYQNIPYSGSLPRLPITYQNAPPYVAAPTATSAPPPHIHPSPYTAALVPSQTFTSPQFVSRSAPPPPPSQAQQQQQQTHIPSQDYAPQLPQLQQSLAPGSASHSIPSSRSHSAENSPAITVRSQPSYAAHSWPPHHPAAIAYGREPFSAPPGVTARSQHAISKTPAVSYSAPILPIEARVPSSQPTRPSLWQNDASMPIFEAAQPLHVDLGVSSREVIAKPTPPAEAQRPVLSKKFSLSTSVKGSTLKSMGKGKSTGETRGRKKKGRELKSELEDHAHLPQVPKSSETSKKSSQNKKRKISPDADHDVDPPSTEVPASASATPAIESDKEREKRLMDKTSIACNMCRSKKLKCNGERPRCYHCVRRGEECCEYELKLRRRGPGKQNKKKATPDADEEGIEGGTTKRKRGGKWGRKRCFEDEHEQEASGFGSNSASTSTSDEDDEHPLEGSSDSPPIVNSTAQSYSHSQSSLKLTDELEERARQTRDRPRLSQGDLKDMSYLFDQRGTGSSSAGIGMGFGGWSNASGSRFELSTARD